MKISMVTIIGYRMSQCQEELQMTTGAIQ